MAEIGETYDNWGDVPVGVVVVDNQGDLVWVKQANGTAIANAVGNSLDSGWVSFSEVSPQEHRYPLTVVGA